jgi:hypothetical protein
MAVWTAEESFGVVKDNSASVRLARSGETVMRQQRFHIAAVAVCFFVAVWSSFGQSTTSQITGAVKDPSGASIAGAQITLTNLQTGIERTVESNELGYYTVALLQPGKYRVTCQKEGFRQLTRTGINLTVDQVARVDLALELGDVTQTVEVQEDVTLVQTDRPESATVILTTQFDRLPLIQQNRMRNPSFGCAAWRRPTAPRSCRHCGSEKSGRWPAPAGSLAESRRASGRPASPRCRATGKNR